MEQENTTQNPPAAVNNEAESSIFESAFGGFMGQSSEPAPSDQKEETTDDQNNG